jgi:hypothetical protein
LQDGTRTSECSLCKINQTSLATATEAVKKIQRYVGHRMLDIQESGFQYQLLVKWHSLSHHHDCWVCFILNADMLMFSYIHFLCSCIAIQVSDLFSISILLKQKEASRQDFSFIQMVANNVKAVCTSWCTGQDMTILLFRKCTWMEPS